MTGVLLQFKERLATILSMSKLVLVLAGGACANVKAFQINAYRFSRNA